ncbi:MAG: thioredoxin family protein [Candidatus Limnocylindria bacterium]|nr:thioredoxin family protein [Candidatus Limnocylindria bacterium]
MTRNREQLEENERAVPLDPADVAAFRALPRPLHVVTIAEDWCADVVANLPVLALLAEASGKLDLRVFDKAKHPELIARYRKEGKFESIPVFVFFDEAFREVGVWIERPASVTARRAERRAAIYASDPAFGSPDAPPADLPDEVRARLLAALLKMRADLKPWADREVIRELREIVGRAVAA